MKNGLLVASCFDAFKLVYSKIGEKCIDSHFLHLRDALFSNKTTLVLRIYFRDAWFSNTNNKRVPESLPGRLVFQYKQQACSGFLILYGWPISNRVSSLYNFLGNFLSFASESDVWIWLKMFICLESSCLVP